MTKKSKKKHIIKKWYNNEEGVRNAGYDDSKYFDINTKEGQQNIIHMKKSMKNPEYFIENFVKLRVLDESLDESQQGRVVNIKLREYQKDLIKNVINERFIVAMMARQMGKCVQKNTFINIIRNKPIDIFKKICYNLLLKVSFIRSFYNNIYRSNKNEKDLSNL